MFDEANSAAWALVRGGVHDRAVTVTRSPPEDVCVVEKRAGSTIVVLEVSQSAADRLLSAFDTRSVDLQNALLSFGLKGVWFAPHRAGDPLTAWGQSSRRQESVVRIGTSMVIKGEINGSEDLTVEGNVEGKIELRERVPTIGPRGKIKAEVFAKSVIVLGEVVGNITASEKVDIRDNGSVDGDIVSPCVAIAVGAHFRGSVDMQRKVTAAPAHAARSQVKPISLDTPSE